MPLEHKGIWLPDGETHMQEQMEHYPLIDGKGTYQLHKLEAALKFVTNLEVAVDIGAHVGLWTRVLAKHFQQVIAFEPYPHLVECFKKNLDGVENVTLHEVAIGDRKAMVGMVFAKDNTGNTHVSPEGADGCLVNMFPLEHYELKNVGLIKIDVEGYELPVVEGALITLLRNKPIVICEHKGNDRRLYGREGKTAIDFLKEIGMVELEVISGDYIMGWK